MIKVIEMIVMMTLLVFVFFIGVKYSDDVKNSASWLFEVKEVEVDVPSNFSSEEDIDIFDQDSEIQVEEDNILDTKEVNSDQSVAQ